jgi:surfactin synthase thioesterase subunit
MCCPITAIGARQDDMVYLDEVAGWKERTSSDCELIAVDGDHWFLNRNKKLIIARLEAMISPVEAKRMAG